MTPALRADDLAVGYRTRRVTRAVLERVNLTAAAGEFICLLGPNGIGKSTLLRTLVRMQDPLWGRVELDGERIDRLSALALARKVGVVLTERVTVDALPVRRIVEIGRYAHTGWLGTVDARGRQVVEWAIDAVGAAHLADRDFNHLSDGERQRVMIARALAQEPSVLVLDEPTAFLDVPSRVELTGLLRQLTRDHRLAVIASTHDLELALRTADRLWLLMPGGEVAAGVPEDIVACGAIASAFAGGHIRFNPLERSFKLQTGQRGTVRVVGDGLIASLARGVLEREGFATGEDEGRPDVTLEIDAHGWRDRRSPAAGADFATLAAFARNWKGES